jgi:hypothetical protein
MKDTTRYLHMHHELGTVYCLNERSNDHFLLLEIGDKTSLQNINAFIHILEIFLQCNQTTITHIVKDSVSTFLSTTTITNTNIVLLRRKM